MSEKQLYTLKEIADELGVNYKTLYVYKDLFEDHLVIKYRGRKVKYLPINIQIFSKLLELRDEGKTNDEMIEYLKNWRRESPELFRSDDLSDCLSDGLTVGLDICRSVGLTVGRSVLLSDCLDVGLSDDRTDCRSDGLTDCLDDCLSDQCSSSIVTGHYEDDQEDVKATGSDQSVEAKETEPTQPQPIQPVQPGPDLETIQDMLDHSLSRLESRILSEVSELLPQMNSALTQFYKFSYELLARLEKIETDLGVEGKPMATELDLEAIQVKMEPAYSHADLEFVKNSVHEGKPDKNAVRQWVLSERRKGPEQSYAALAEVLNDAGVPTLSGREGWNRGTLRNIVVER
ncbi:MerR HTH family regulatory protein [Desulfonatronum zhilinae]|nr:MerR HTH family regulatory protein [Desulfonatronum zhilinae]